MTWSLALIQTIIIAGITGWVSYIVGKWQRGNEYQYNYKQYILDKRKEAYSTIENAINELRKINRSYSYSDVSESSKILTDIVESTHSVIWASPELLRKLNAMRLFFVELLVFGNINSIPEDQEISPEENRKFWEVFKKNHSKFEIYLSELETAFFNDLMSLNNIDKYIKDRSEWKGIPFDASLK